MAGLGTLAIELGASTAQLSSDFDRAKGIVSQAVADINVTINKVGQGANFNGVTTQIESLKGSFASLQNVIGGVFGASIGAAGVRQLMDVADQYQNVTNRILTTTSGTAELIAVQDRLFAISQETGQSLDATAKIYQRLEQVIEGTGKTQFDAQTQALSVTKTLNEEMVLSGATVAEATRAITDMVHGMAGGVLQTRQMRMMMQQMPDLARVLAEGLGVSVKQLTEMVHAGLPVADVLKALSNEAGKIDERFQSMPKTFARVWTELSNAVEQYVGRASQAGEVSTLVKDAISGLAANINTVAAAAELVGIAMAAWLGGKGLQTISVMMVALKEMTLAQGEYKTSAMLSAEADIAFATAQQKALAATQAKLVAETELRDAEIGELAAKQRAIAAEVALAEARTRTGQYSANILLDEARMIELETELAGSTNTLTAAIAKQDAAMAQLVGADTAAAAATVRLTEAQAALAAEQTAGALAMGGLSRAGAGLFAMLGGWPTVILAAAAGIYYLATAESDLEKQTDAVIKLTNDLKNSHGALAPEMEKAANAAYDNARALQETAQKELDLKVAQENSIPVTAANQASLFALGAEAEKLAGNLDAAKVATGQLAGAFLQAKAAAAGHWLQDFFVPDINVSLAAVDKFNAGMDKTGEKLKEQAATYHMGHAAVLQYKIDQELAAESVGKSAAEIAILKKALDEGNVANLAAARSLDAVTEAGKRHASGSKAVAAANAAEYASMQKLTEYADKLAAKVDDSLAGKAYANYNAAVTKANDLAEKALIDGNNLNAVISAQNIALDAAKETYDKATASIGDFDTIMQTMADTYAKDEQLAGLSTQARKLAIEVEKAEAQALKDLQAIQGKGAELSPSQIAQIKAETVAHIANTDAIEAAKKAQQEWQTIFTSGLGSVGKSIADFATGAITSWKNFGASLVTDAKTFIAQIIEEFLKLQVFNGIINNLFGSNLPVGIGGSGGSLVSAGLGLLSSGSSGSGGFSGFGAGVDFTSNAAGGTSNSLFGTVQNVYGAGKTLWEGFSGGFSNLLSTNAYTMGPPTLAGSTSSFSPGYSSGFGQALGVAGGAYAAYNEYNAAGGGATGLAGAAAYGVGTYFAGAAASAALSGGIAAGLAAVPVVGWIALAAMGINMLSGGKLFGTGADTFSSGKSDLTIGPNGGSVGNSVVMQGQDAFFGGAYYETKNLTTSADQATAATAFYTQLKAGVGAFAAQFGQQMGQVIGGVFSQPFDQNGKPTGTTSTTVQGQTYSGETQAQFGERLQADNYLAVLDKMGLGASKFVAGLQSNADKLFAGVQDFAGAAQAANVDLKNGLHFLAEGAGKTLVSVMKFVEGLQGAGETLTQTYARLAAAQNTYDKFVAQFKPAATYVDDFEAKMAAVQAQLKANIAQANAYAKAAGAEGAATSDLVNMHQAAANQMAALVSALAASAQSLAFSLGITNVGTLSEVNAEIARLTGLQNSAASATRGFASAVSTAAQSATSAIALLLGNLSPLSDAQKLQIALQGQRAGTVTPDQVLQIGRALYASSEAYVQLFAQVQAIGNHTGQGRAGSGASGGGSSGTAASFTAEDAARLAALQKEQPGLQAAQTYGQFKTFAQQLAEYSSATGETYTKVIKEWGVDTKALEKGLGLKSDADLATYIAKIQTQTDSNKDNTLSIVNELKLILDAIKNPGGTQLTPGAHGAHGTRPLGPTSANGTPIVDLSPGTINSIGSTIQRGMLGNTRNLRGVAP